MKKIYCSFIFIFLTGCEAIPTFNQCATPKFLETGDAIVQQYFLTEDLFAKFCPADTPKILSYKVSSEITLSLSQTKGWVYLKASNREGNLSIYTKGLRLADFKGFTHVVSVSSLSGNSLPLVIDGGINFEVNYTVINCTCLY